MKATSFNYTGFDIQGHQVAVISKDEVAVGCIHVTREQVEKVLSLMNNYSPPTTKFKVGDFVRVLGSEGDRVPIGEYGEVVLVDENNSYNNTIGVKFARRYDGLHGIRDGIVPWGHGYWFRPDELKKVD